MNPIELIMRTSPVIPVLTIQDPAQARPIAEALVAGGLRVLEVTLRTPAALEAIQEMLAVDGVIVGAGTVLNPAQLDGALDAGAKFIVSPGLTERLAHAAAASGAPFLPGVATASDLQKGYDLDLRHFKFFPAEAAGGVRALASLAGPFREALFCPTGGITLATAPDWLGLPSVLCVGGSWLDASGAGNLHIIRSAAAAVIALFPDRLARS